MRYWAVLLALLLALGVYFSCDIGKNPPQSPSDDTVKSVPKTKTGTPYSQIVQTP